MSKRERTIIIPGDTSIVPQHDGWWIGSVQEVHGVNSQARTREERIDNLRDALQEALEMNRAEAKSLADGSYVEVSLTV